MRRKSLSKDLENVSMPMKRGASISSNPNKRARKTLDLSSFRYQPDEQLPLTGQPLSDGSGLGSSSLLVKKGSRESPIDLRTQPSSATPSPGPHRSSSISSSPLSSVDSSIADKPVHVVDQLLAAAGTQSSEVHRNTDTVVDQSNTKHANRELKKRLLVRLKLPSAFLARYPNGVTKKSRRSTGNWVPRPAPTSETQIPWADLVREAFANSESGVMTHHEVWRVMEDKFSAEMLSRNQRTTNWKKSVHSTLHAIKDFYTTERPTSGWKWAVVPQVLRQRRAGKERSTSSTPRHPKLRISPTKSQDQDEPPQDSEPDVYDIRHIDRPQHKSFRHEESLTATKQPFGRGPNWRDLIIEAFLTSPSGFMRLDEICQAIEARHPIHRTSVGSEDWSETYVRTVLIEDHSFQETLGHASQNMWSLATTASRTQIENDNEDVLPISQAGISPYFPYKTFKASRAGLMSKDTIYQSIESPTDDSLDSRLRKRPLLSENTYTAEMPVLSRSTDNSATAEAATGDGDVVPSRANTDGMRKTTPKEYRNNGPRWRALITEALQISSSGPLTKNEICRAIKARHPIDTLGVRAKDWSESVRLVLGKEPMFYKSRSSGTIKWGLKPHVGIEEESTGDKVTSRMTSTEHKQDTTSRYYVHDLPKWHALIVQAFKESHTTLLTRDEVCHAIKSRYSGDTLEARDKKWPESVWHFLRKDPAFFQSRSTSGLHYGLNTRLTKTESERNDEDEVSVLINNGSEQKTSSIKRSSKGPNWRGLITEALEASRSGLLTSLEVCRAIETRHPIETLGFRSKNWRIGVKSVLSKDAAFRKRGGIGKVKWGLANRRIGDTESDEEDPLHRAPVYTDGKHKWAELPVGTKEEDLYSDDDSNVPRAHVIEDYTGSWRLRQTPKMQNPPRRRRQITPAPRTVGVATANSVGVYEKLTARERAILPIAMQWLMHQGTLDGGQEDPFTLFNRLTDASFLPTLTRPEALDTVTTAANLLQAQILKAEDLNVDGNDGN
ncbi:hypothetical protein P7C71_g5039, partial [Lecanoromycetidae sp. Uapishka_2]